jgi:hypothetical protein
MSMPNAVAGDKAITKAYLQNMYMKYLDKGGYSPEIDDDGDVRFHSNNHTFFISVNENDPQFLRIVLPNIWPIDSGAEAARALIAANYTNRKIKVTKLFAIRKNIWASIETFVAKPDDFAAIFKRSLEALEGGVMRFSMKMRQGVQPQSSSIERGSMALPKTSGYAGII